MTDGDFFEPKEADFPSPGDEPEDLAKIADRWYQSGRAKHIDNEPPAELRRRFETCSRQVEQLKTALRERLAQVHEWDALYVLGLYTTFATTVASLIARANAAETFPDSVFARRADEHFKFLEIWLPMWVKRETLSAVEAFGPTELSRFLTRPDNIRQFRVRLDSAVGNALRAKPGQLHARSDVKSAASAQGTPDGRRGYRLEVRAWMRAKNLRTIAEAARRLSVSVDTLKSIMTEKGKKRYGDDTLRKVLKNIDNSA